MSDTEKPAQDLDLFYGLGLRSATVFKTIDSIEGVELGEGENPRVTLEVPGAIAYELAYALAMYGKSLHEFATDEDPSSESEMMRARGRFVLEVSELIHGLAQDCFKLLGQDGTWPIIDTTTDPHMHLIGVDEEPESTEAADDTEEA